MRIEELKNSPPQEGEKEEMREERKRRERETEEERLFLPSVLI